MRVRGELPTPLPSRTVRADFPHTALHRVSPSGRVLHLPWRHFALKRIQTEQSECRKHRVAQTQVPPTGTDTTSYSRADTTAYKTVEVAKRGVRITAPQSTKVTMPTAQIPVKTTKHVAHCLVLQKTNKRHMPRLDASLGFEAGR